MDLPRGKVLYDYLMESNKGNDYGSTLALLPYAVQGNMEELERIMVRSVTYHRRLKICYPGIEQEPDARKIIRIGDVPDGYMYMKK